MVSTPVSFSVTLPVADGADVMDESEAELEEEAVALADGVALSVPVTDDESQSETVELEVASLAEGELSEAEAVCVDVSGDPPVIEVDEDVGAAVSSDEDDATAVGSDEMVAEEGVADAYSLGPTEADTELFDPGML